MTSETIVIGVLAHVDSGKTTLSEGLLYLSGQLKKLGRVDHRDAFFDTDPMERRRGITIFSKQAQLTVGEKQAVLLDTPGHTDFSAEMERTLQVLDYAILVINGANGVQSHTATLWRLLAQYQIPTFLFINKMDQPGTDRQALLQELQSRLSDRCLDLSDFDAAKEAFHDQAALCSEEMMEEYLDTGAISVPTLAQAICRRQLFPCCFGSALKMDGVAEFAEIFGRFTRYPEYPDTFGAKVYKITRDPQGNRLTHLKLTGGELQVKSWLDTAPEKREKVDQIRLYNGSQYQMAPCVRAGTVCAVTGLEATGAGQGLGHETGKRAPLLVPVLTYRITPRSTDDVHGIFLKLKQLEEEVPHLQLTWNETLGEIHAQVMGPVEIEILEGMIAERFGIEVSFDSGSFVYKETITAPVEGVGHFEPLRHYAEVHLLLEPGERGSGLQFESRCSEDVLDRNWQRLILTHLAEKSHPGVLTGSSLTDVKISLLSGRAHLKHTEGGDFRQATYRAVRQGLKKAACVLLEPVYDFVLEIPPENVGRALSDIQKMHGSFDPPQSAGAMSVITGSAPVSEMQEYASQVTSYTHGQGKLLCSLAGYQPCHDQEAVIRQFAYDPERDLENPTGSVFCAHGAGFPVPWDEVEDHMHLPRAYTPSPPQTKEELSAKRPASFADSATDKELEAIFTRTYGPIRRERNHFHREPAPTSAPSSSAATQWGKREKYLLVDGYNIIFAWEELKALARQDLASARGRLMDILSNYQGVQDGTLIVVFDAYRVKGGVGSVEQYHNIHVIYTKEAETADQYIEKVVHRLGKDHDITVATSDSLEQVIICANGALRLSAQGLKELVEKTNSEIRITCLETALPAGHRPFQNLREALEGASSILQDQEKERS